MKYQVFQLISKYRKQLMGFAALWIFLFHEWRVLSHSIPIIGPTALFVKRIGFTGVDIFFCLSGMGLVYSAQKPGILNFYKSRIRRIALPYVFVALAVYFFEHRNVVILLRNIFGINFYTIDIYSFLWFVPAIATIYFFFPAYFRVFNRFKNKYVVTSVTIVIWLLLSLIVKDKMRTDLFGFTNRIPVFIIGVLFGWISMNRGIVFGRKEILLSFLVLISGVIIAYLTNYNGLYLLVPESNCCIPSIMISISAIFLLSVFFEYIRGHCQIFSNILAGILSFFGTFTLEFYCVQEYVGDKVISLLEKFRVNNLWVDLILLISCTLTGWLLSWLHRSFWRLIDRLKK